MYRDEEWYRLLSEINSLKSYKAIENIVPNYILTDFQCVDLLRLLHAKRYCLFYDTGIGKTLMAGAMINAVRKENPKAKFLMIVLKSQLAQTPEKMKDYTGLRVSCFSAESVQIKQQMFRKDFVQADIVILTHDCLNNMAVMSKIYEEKDKFCGIIIDEAHNLSNFHEAKSSMMLFSMAKQFEYCLALTATPTRVEAKQTARLLYLVSRDSIDDINKQSHIIENEGLKCYTDVAVVRTRKELNIVTNYKTSVHMIKPLAHQVGVTGINLFQTTKGEGAQPQVNKLVEIIKSYPEYCKGLVYIRHHAVREYVINELDKAGIKYECINGQTPLKKRNVICKDFNSGKLDIVITSVTEALDLDCEYIIFYEFDVNIQQMVGRGNRGLNPKQLDIHFIFTKDTGESMFFLTNVYNRSIIIRNIMGQDMEYIRKAALDILYS